MLKDFNQENKVKKVKKLNHFTRFFTLFFFLLFFFFIFTSSTFAATYYWVGNNGGLTSVKGNWHTSPKACDGAGNATAAPVAADSINFVSQCPSNATIDATFSVTNITIASGYIGTITTNTGININVSGNFTKADGTWTSGGSVTFNGTNPSTVTANGVLGGKVVINKGAIDGQSQYTFTVTTGTTINLGDSPTSVLTSSGGWYGRFLNNGTILVGTGTWVINSANGLHTSVNNGTITNGGDSWVFSNSNFTNSATGIINYTGTTISINGNFSQLGTFDLTGKTVTFNGCKVPLF